MNCSVSVEVKDKTGREREGERKEDIKKRPKYHPVPDRIYSNPVFMESFPGNPSS